METGTSKKEARRHALTKATALKFVLLIGAMSFFADFAYEGSRSIIGPYLAVLGASAVAVGIVTGFGELLGYGLRLVSGRLSDQTGNYFSRQVKINSVQPILLQQVVQSSLPRKVWISIYLRLAAIPRPCP